MAACLRRAPAGTSTWLGTTRTAHPAASAAAAPVTESSMARQSRGSTPSSAAARRYGSGAGLPAGTSSPQTDSVNQCVPMVLSA
ncbi:Uncharacterised protein [Mycobacteroides abscessus subsp. abscessus]|nr:Uncharacterised protein [Mycobacteroides abscessus subsp. abscessus]